ncbi:MAG TPA: response regulator [Nitrososphaeraceae archaeon]|jgi:DNA-binding response OmpR family regulator
MINNQKKNNRILLVDNEIDISSAFKIGLEDNGFEVDAFDKPDAALSYFNQGMYDLLLLDIKMPKMNGIEFYKRMKEIDEKVKVCFITASEIHYFEEIAKEIFPILGVRRLIRKPIKIQDLVKTVKAELLD